ncbi:MAG: hypothetical protein HC836_32550 [Richelia sp. RM2_1_2]|nr:hypothetical protein [Richelia sp. SM1_7_0]NJN10450.1 hypothetical protein [Richelia sp. RM1_1_1]NJO62785.1 hypothetical protein [Richelia sp. RM2_1_2]
MKTDTTNAFSVDFVKSGLPLIISFGFAQWNGEHQYDFVGRLKRVEQIAQRQLNKIFLKDSTNSWYHNGVQGLGESIDEVAQSLQALIESMQPSRIIAVGQSMGGYAAIAFGILLKVDTVISFGSLSCLDSRFAQLTQDTRWLPCSLQLESSNLSCSYFDLIPLCQSKPAHTKIHYIFGSRFEDEETGEKNLDVLHASRLHGACLDIKFYAYPQSAHTVVKYLVDRKKINSLLLKLIFGIDESEVINGSG